MAEDESKRGFNYNEREKSLLLDLVDHHKAVLECKRTDKVTTKDKDRVWDTLAKQFNEEDVGQCVRTATSLKTCYENVKKRAKRSSGQDKVQLFLTGGGIKKTKVTDEQARVIAMIPNQFIPEDNPYDCDASGPTCTAVSTSKPIVKETIPVPPKHNHSKKKAKFTSPALQKQPKSPYSPLKLAKKPEIIFNKGLPDKEVVVAQLAKCCTEEASLSSEDCNESDYLDNISYSASKTPKKQGVNKSTEVKLTPADTNKKYYYLAEAKLKLINKQMEALDAEEERKKKKQEFEIGNLILKKQILQMKLNQLQLGKFENK